jgi:hypothetical protein
MKDKILENKKEDTEILGTNIKKRKTTDEDQYRVVISKESNDVLEKFVERTNDGFDGGEVNKSDIANAIFLGAAKTFSEADIRSLRNLHFNERKMLRAILRKSEDAGELPEEIKKALREHYGLSEQNKKRNSRAQSELSTDKNVDNLGVS